MDAFFIGRKFPYSRQWSDQAYRPVAVQIIPEMLTEHFFEDGKKVGTKVRGSIGVVPNFGRDSLRWICIDLDNAEDVKLAEKLLDKFESLGIVYMEELGGDELERRHIWVRVDARQTVVKELFTRIVMVTYELNDRNKVSELFPEMFGVNKTQQLIRVMLGWHLKRNKRYPVIIPSTGEITDDPVTFMKGWLEMPVLTEERIEKLLSSLPVIEEKKSREYKSKSFQFVYRPRHLPLPVADMPKLMYPVMRNCQAANGILSDVVDDKGIELKGEIPHARGLVLSGLAAFNDEYHWQYEKKRITTGKEWFIQLRRDFRMREDKSHEWMKSWETAKHDLYRVFSTCKYYEEKFNKCTGCPFYGKIESPKQFIGGTELRSTSIKKVKLTTAEEIRKTTFVDFKEHVIDLMSRGERDNILLASPQGSGKSVAIRDLACTLSKQDKKVLFAIPATKLALEYKSELRDCGTESFVLSSHKSGFEHKLVDFECPDFDPIQNKLKLGVSSATIKKQHCHSCPLNERCYYPRQYQEVMSPQHKVVIIQHAHFSTQEVIWELMKKRFDALFIDESFIGNIFNSVKIDPLEIEALKAFDFNWSEELVRWLKGGESTGWMGPHEDELEEVYDQVEVMGLAWRVPELIRFYNQRRKVSPYHGIEVIYELPNIPVRVFTDATPPEDLIKKVTGVSSLTTFGKGEVIDYRKIHPDNTIIQVLDNSTSVTSLKDKEKWEAILMKVGELIELRFPQMRGLLTCYKNDFKRVEEFFLRHREEFPTVLERVLIERMDKGTNAYAGLDFQFLLAGVYFIGNDYIQDTYKYKAVHNHFRDIEGLPLLSNPYPNLEGMVSVKQRKVPVSRIEVIGSEGHLVEYPGLELNRPQDTWHEYCHDLNIGNTQQAIRMRFTPDKPRYVYVLNNMPLPSFLIRESITMEEFLRPLPSEGGLW